MKKLSLFAVLLAVALSPITSQADEAQTVQAEKKAKISKKEYREMIASSVTYLREKGQAEDGSFTGSRGIGPTGLVMSGLLAVGTPTDDPMVARGLKYLVKHVQPTGGIYTLDSNHRNYDTCIAIMAFVKANKDGKYNAVLKKAEAFVKGLQWDDTEGKTEDDPFFGGAGYGSHSRPDLSNTTFLIEALHELGNGSEDATMKKALTFVSRCQNLEGANDSEFADKINDGGFYYTVAAGGESKAGVEENGGLRSYGSMTYAGLKSMIYAGVSSDDDRVKAAVKFLQKNYDLESNPGMGEQGLYYYYHTMAKALSALGADEFKSTDGTTHDWKAELAAKLHAKQNEDGSWTNPTTRWMEGDANLVTGYVLMALPYCEPAE